MFRLLKKIQPLVTSSINKCYINSTSNSLVAGSWDKVYKETKSHIRTIKHHHDERLATIASDLLNVIDYISKKKIKRGEFTNTLEWDNFIKEKMNQCNGSFQWRKNKIHHDEFNQEFYFASLHRTDVLYALKHIENLFTELDKIIFPSPLSQEQRGFGL